WIAARSPEMTECDGSGGAGAASLIVIAPPQTTPSGDLAEERAAREVRRGAVELVFAPARTARTRPKSRVPVARTENSVTRRPSGRALVMLSPPPRVGYVTFLQPGAGQFK